MSVNPDVPRYPPMLIPAPPIGGGFGAGFTRLRPINPAVDDETRRARRATKGLFAFGPGLKHPSGTPYICRLLDAASEKAKRSRYDKAMEQTSRDMELHHANMVRKMNGPIVIDSKEPSSESGCSRDATLLCVVPEVVIISNSSSVSSVVIMQRDPSGQAPPQKKGSTCLNEEEQPTPGCDLAEDDGEEATPLRLDDFDYIGMKVQLLSLATCGGYFERRRVAVPPPCHELTWALTDPILPLCSFKYANWLPGIENFGRYLVRAMQQLVEELITRLQSSQWDSDWHNSHPTGEMVLPDQQLSSGFEDTGPESVATPLIVKWWREDSPASYLSYLTNTFEDVALEHPDNRVLDKAANFLSKQLRLIIADAVDLMYEFKYSRLGERWPWYVNRPRGPSDYPGVDLHDMTPTELAEFESEIGCTPHRQKRNRDE